MRQRYFGVAVSLAVVVGLLVIETRHVPTVAVLKASTSCDLNAGNPQRGNTSHKWIATVGAVKNSCANSARIHVWFSGNQQDDTCSGWGVNQTHSSAGPGATECWTEFGTSGAATSIVARPGCGPGGYAYGYSDANTQRQNTMGVAPCQHGHNPDFDGTYNPWDQDCFLEWDGTAQVWECDSPLILPVGPKHPFLTTTPANGVWFDIDADGAGQQTAWMQGDDDSAFLAIDRNDNGRIDNASELFGDHTLPGRENGFDALNAFVEFTGGPTDGGLTVLDRTHPLFRQLLLWQDKNHNGLSEPDELRPFGQVFKSINLNYDYAQRVDRNGNLFGFKGTATTRAGQVVRVFDVYFKAGQ